MESISIVQDLQKKLNYFDVYNNFSNIVFLCIGTNRIIGDSLGPLVGERLDKLFNNREDVIVYGNMSNTLNIKNTKIVLEKIREKYENPFIIIIDAALGRKEMIGTIAINKGNIVIGNSLKNSVYCRAHINIKGVVGEYKETIKENCEVLKNIKIDTINNISSRIANGICRVIE